MLGDEVPRLPLHEANTEANTREANKTAAIKLGRPRERLNRWAFNNRETGPNRRFEETFTYKG